MPTLPVPESPVMKSISFVVSTGEGDSRKSRQIECSLPASIGDAIALEGPREVFKKYIRYVMLQKQNEERLRMKDRTEKPRVRASYLDELGI